MTASLSGEAVTCSVILDGLHGLDGGFCLDDCLFFGLSETFFLLEPSLGLRGLSFVLELSLGLVGGLIDLKNLEFFFEGD
jgi:hypothetical protein